VPGIATPNASPASPAAATRAASAGMGSAPPAPPPAGAPRRARPPPPGGAPAPPRGGPGGPRGGAPAAPARQAGQLLVELGAVEQAYADAMQERELVLSSYVGEGFALPHGTDASRAFVRRAALVFLQYPEGIDWEGDDVRACVAIAAASDEHVSVMAALAKVLVDPQQAEELRTTDDKHRVLSLLTPA
jgi:mannitol/fructose-specific phosphotransferase system IIA component